MAINYTFYFIYAVRLFLGIRGTIMNTMIKKVADNIYHSIVDETDVARFYGQDLLDFIKNNQVSNHSALILETRSKRCDMTCDRAFFTGVQSL